MTGSPAEHAAEIRKALIRGDLDDRRLSGKSYSGIVLQKNLAALAVLERQAEEAEDLHERWQKDVARMAREVNERQVAATARVQQLEEALEELEQAVTPKLGTMNYYFGPGSRTAVSRESEKEWQRIKTACDSARAVLVVPSPPECSCGGIDAVPHATDHHRDCSIWGEVPSPPDSKEGE